MTFDGFGCRDLQAPDLLPVDLIKATPPGSETLVKGSAPSAVSILIEFDVETVS